MLNKYTHMKTLTVKGVHCGACEKLIKMELEDVGLDILVEKVEIDGEKKEGIFSVKETIGKGELEEMKSIINGMEGYSVE